MTTETETLTPERISEIMRRHLTRAECVEFFASDPARVATNLRLLQAQIGGMDTEREVALMMLRAARMTGGAA